MFLINPNDESVPRGVIGWWLPALLGSALILRLVLHAFFLPVFEGPDEPFHLSRALDWADAFHGRIVENGTLQPQVLAAVKLSPCGADLHRAFGCPSWGEEADAAFNILSQRTSTLRKDETVTNYQAHQPPLPYLAMGAVLAPLGAQAPEAQLLVLRLFSVALIAGGLLCLAGTLSRRGLCLALLLLWLPGATESLVRVANDVAVFAWSAVVTYWLVRGGRSWGRSLLVGAGPFLKLTAVPVVVFALWVEWREGRRLEAWLGALVASLIVPVQALRGWAWGGTLELNVLGSPTDSLVTMVTGVLHSAYTFLKTAGWLGGWSVFRPPAWLVILSFGLGFLWLIRLRPQRKPKWRVPHGAGLVISIVGFCAFALGKRQLFGLWGAVGGWYLWSWFPWLALLAEHTLAVRGQSSSRAWLYGGTTSWVILVNIFWWVAAIRLYGF